MVLQGKGQAPGAAAKKAGGYGSRMLEGLEKQGKPVDERMKENGRLDGQHGVCR